MILPCLIAWFATNINRPQDHIIAYLREENRILKAKLKGKRIHLTDTERRRLAVLAHPIERKHLKDLSYVIDGSCRFARSVPFLSIRPQGQLCPIGHTRAPPDAASLERSFASRRVRGQRVSGPYLVPSTRGKSQSDRLSDASRCPLSFAASYATAA